MNPVDAMKVALDALEYQIQNFPLEAHRLLPGIDGLRVAITEMENQTPVAWSMKQYPHILVSEIPSHTQVSEWNPLVIKDALGHPCESECVACVGCAP